MRHLNWRRWFLRLSISGLFFLLSVLFLEVLLRFAGYGNLLIYQPDPKLYWTPKPNQTCFTKIGRKPVHINSWGTRGAEFDLEKSKNVYRVLFLGDSRTFGWGLAEEETYAELLEKLLNKYLDGARVVEAINAGVNAWSYHQIFVFLRDKALTYQPDLVVVSNANLWTVFSEENSANFANAFMRRVWLKNLLRRSAIYHYIVEVRLRKYYEKYRHKFIPKPKRDDEVEYEEREDENRSKIKNELARISRLLSSHQIPQILLYVPREDEVLAKAPSDLVSIKKQISMEWNVPLLDMTPVFDMDFDRPLYMDVDPVHPNSEGNLIIARELYNEIVKTLLEEESVVP